MNDLLYQANQYMSLIGFIVTLLSIPFSLFLYQKSKPKKEIGIFIRNFRLLHENIKSVSKLIVEYNTEKITNLTVSEIYFWNNGKLTITENEIVKLAPICIFSRNGKILDIALSSVIEQTNNFSLKLKNDSTNGMQSIHFDYVEPNEGCVITVYHTGNTIELSGRLQGGKIKYQSEAPIKKKTHWMQREVTLPTGIFFIIIPIFNYKTQPGMLGLIPIGLLFVASWIYDKKKRTPKIFNEISSNFHYSEMYNKGE